MGRPSAPRHLPASACGASELPRNRRHKPRSGCAPLSLHVSKISEDNPPGTVYCLKLGGPGEAERWHFCPRVDQEGEKQSSKVTIVHGEGSQQGGPWNRRKARQEVTGREVAGGVPRGALCLGSQHLPHSAALYPTGAEAWWWLGEKEALISSQKTKPELPYSWKSCPEWGQGPPRMTEPNGDWH